jgi:hypothetical protein
MLSTLPLISPVGAKSATLRAFVITLTFLAVSLGPSPQFSRTADSPKQHKVEGEVLERTNAPIPIVLVRIYRSDTNIKLNEGSSGKDGRYSISFSDPGEPIRIRYDLTGWEPDEVGNISGSRDQRITKVLNRVGTARSYSQKQRLVALLNLFYEIDRANNVSRQEFLKQYDAVIARASFPDELQRQLAFDIRPDPVPLKNAVDEKIVCSTLDDLSLTQSVKDKLSKSQWLRTSEINVQAEGHVVTLTGRVLSSFLKRTATREAAEVTCVLGVNNLLVVTPK